MPQSSNRTTWPRFLSGASLLYQLVKSQLLKEVTSRSRDFVILICASTANLLHVSDLFLSTTAEIVKKTRLHVHEVERVLDVVSANLSRAIQAVSETPPRVLKTGDARLDLALGGGFRTGLLWEIAGER